jgi:excisionase family DNA binding protein
MSKKSQNLSHAKDNATAWRDLKVNEAAAELNAHASTIYRQIKRRNLLAYRLGDPDGNGPYRIRPSDLDAYKNACAVRAIEEPLLPIPRRDRSHQSRSHLRAIERLRQRGVGGMSS